MKYPILVICTSCIVALAIIAAIFKGFALKQCVIRGSTIGARMLLTASPSSIDSISDASSGRSLLHMACFRNSTEIAALLIEYKASVNDMDKNGHVALHGSAFNGYSQIVDLLIKAGADVNARGKDGGTPLHFAAMGGHSLVADMLIARGADPRAVTTVKGYSALHAATEKGRLEIVELLLEKFPELDLPQAISSEGFTALHAAAHYGHPQIAAVLLNYGAQIDARDNEMAKTPLHAAVTEGQIEVVKVLLSSDASIGLTNSEGQTARDIAVAKGYVDIKDVLDDYHDS